MSAKVLIKTSDLSRADWLRYRTMGIGGSDVSVIAGINPYRSVYQIWLEKTGQIEPAESDNEYTHFGTILEPVVRKEFMARTGLKVRQKHMLLQSVEHPFMLANLDGVINLNGEMCIFEAKTASAYKLDDWQSGIPPEYMLQVQHYMAVTGAAKTYIAALIGGNHFEYRLIDRDDEMIAKIIAMEKLFWEINVLGGIAPEIDGTKATTEFFNSKYSFSNGQTIELPEEIVSDCEEYGRLSDEISKLTTAKDAICNRIKSLMQNNETGVAGKYKISWKQVISSGFDKTRLKADNPELYKKYVTHSQYRRFSMS